MKKILILTSIISACGCSSKILETTSLPDSAVSKLGTVYYLPKALIPISIAVQERPKSPTSESTTNSTAQSITNNVTVNNVPAPTPKNEVAPDAEPSLQFTVTVKGNQIIPDTSKTYFLEYFPENSSDDEVSISVNSNQLLQTNSAKSTDDSGKAVVMVAKLIGEVAKLVATHGLGGVNTFAMISEPNPAKPPEKTYVCKLKPTTIETFLDPSANPKTPYTLAALNNLVHTHGLPLDFKITPVSKASTSGGEASTPVNKDSNSLPDAKTCQHKWGSWIDDECTGIFFRASVPYQLTVSVNQDSKFDPLEESQSDKAKTADKLTSCLTPESSTRDLTILAPNDGPVFSVDVSRAMLVTKKTDLTINDGMLAKIDVNKPSQLVAGLQIPLDIVKELASVPADILTLRIKRYQDEGNLTKAQVELLSQEIQKIKENKELFKTQQSN
jgi:hypothetical protein